MNPFDFELKRMYSHEQNINIEYYFSSFKRCYYSPKRPETFGNLLYSFDFAECKWEKTCTRLFNDGEVSDKKIKEQIFYFYDQQESHKPYICQLMNLKNVIQNELCKGRFKETNKNGNSYTYEMKISNIRFKIICNDLLEIINLIFHLEKDVELLSFLKKQEIEELTRVFQQKVRLRYLFKNQQS